MLLALGNLTVVWKIMSLETRFLEDVEDCALMPPRGNAFRTAENMQEELKYMLGEYTISEGVEDSLVKAKRLAAIV